MSDIIQFPDKKTATEQASELYPELSHYFSVFDPEELVIYPPPPQKEAAVQDAGGKNSGKLILAALIPLLVAAAAVFVFILIGIITIPAIEA